MSRLITTAATVALAISISTGVAPAAGTAARAIAANKPAARAVAAIKDAALSGRAQHAIVVSESEPASKAGLEILQHGGNAVDAACATALAVGVTNPASCGIGGGGFMLVYIAKTGKFYALDYRERAPFKAAANMFVRDGKTEEKLARDGVLAVATPGEIAGIDTALHRLGTMKFQAIAAPAIRLARGGFPLSEHLAREIEHFAPALAADPGLRAVFLKADGTAPKAGDTIAAKNLAATLEALGDDPVQVFYHGEIARRISEFMSEHGGLITANDLGLYTPIWREPLHSKYHDFDVVAMPPPSSGAIVLEMLGMLEPGHLGGLGVNSPPYLARLIEVMRQGFTDRDQYADPAFVDVPVFRLLSPEHIAEARSRAMHHRIAPAPEPAHDHGTSNLLVADQDGNVVALTTTINTPFGSKVTVGDLGIILNDEMDDFAVAPGVPNAFGLRGAKANEIAPGKRPLSSMTPIIVMRGGRPVFTTGGSGGPTIITGVLQVTLNVLDSHLGAARAVDEPRVHEQAAPDIVAVEPQIAVPTRDALQKMGYKLRMVPNLGAVGAITIAPGNLRGASDPRKGGAAAGY
ncbi:MAG TPA: gamma-glutamyltransferase [Candidatus Binataceae bacterium]